MIYSTDFLLNIFVLFLFKLSNSALLNPRTHLHFLFFFFFWPIIWRIAGGFLLGLFGQWLIDRIMSGLDWMWVGDVGGLGYF